MNGTNKTPTDEAQSREDAATIASPTPHLECQRCGARFPLGPAFEGCPRCSDEHRAVPLEVRYDLDWHRAHGTLDAWRTRAPGLWSYRELLPLPAQAENLTLFEGGTPLVRLDIQGPGVLWAKDETRNPTGAFKDRFHAVSVSMARHLGFTKVTSATTGNHGTSLAAYAARAGLRCVIFADPGAPEVQRDLIALFGAGLVVVKSRRDQLAWLVRERGWYPSTGLIPWPMATPYGIEGYKTIGYEIFFQMGARMPAAVICPTSVGDVLYGPWRGFQELQGLGADGPLPAMHAAQAAGCDPIVRAYHSGAREVPVHPAPDTIAQSIGDETAASYTMDAIYDSGGSAVSVSDRQLLDGMRLLARHGIAAEPSSAASVAVALEMQRRGEIADGADVVCLVTGAAAKWPADLALAAARGPLPDEEPAAIRAWLEAFDAGA